uniref:Zona pellucida sperm-binding protein 3 n=1 Tax=Neogobius melanostomus TaxID=47308 RepID=A0A8C6TXF3_9GOBI
PNMNRNVSLTCWLLVLPFWTKSQTLYNHGTDHSTPGAFPRPVVVKCHPESWEIVVQADLFSTGLMVDGRHLRLGVEQRRDPSACRAVPSGPTQFTVQAQLTDCGTVKLPPTEEKIIYSNVVIYSPEPSQDGLLRLGGATIPVLFCKYPSDRFQSALERESHVYYVGDPIHFEGSCILGNHKPLRVFVDHCVATATPDPDAALRYDFIDHGCLADAYLTNSSARFLSRTEDHKIRFQLDAFTFYQENANQLYITCRLTAVLSMVNVESRHRVCSLIDNRWCSADGDDEDCTSCAIPYPPRKSLNRASSAARTDVKSAQAMTSRELGRKMPKQQPATHLLPTKMYTQLISLCWVNERRRKRKGESFIVL